MNTWPATAINVETGVFPGAEPRDYATVQEMN
jgi:hypothetical protein